MERAILLDRDGTLIVERNYLCDPDGVELEHNVLPALRALSAAGYLLVVVTNQSGIGRGLFGRAEFEAVQARLEELLAAGGVRLSATYHCPHHPTAGVGEFLRDCPCRKPEPGMLEQAVRELDLDRAACVMVGDTLSDVGAGHAAGMRTVLVRTGHGARFEARAEAAGAGGVAGNGADQGGPAPAPLPDHVADDLLSAVRDFILPGAPAR